MSEEEIIKNLEEFLKGPCEICKYCDGAIRNHRKAIQGLLDLYQKEKEKNEKLEEYANWHILHLTEDISDYIDDDRIGNKGIIGELKEEREHWKDIIRINNNEKTYIDYKNYQKKGIKPWPHNAVQHPL